MKKFLFFVTSVLCISCGGGSLDMSPLDDALQEVKDSMQKAELYVRQYRMSRSAEDLMRLAKMAECLTIEYDEDNLDETEKRKLFSERLRVDSARLALQEIIARDVCNLRVPQVKLVDHLIEATEKHGFYGTKGDTLNLNVTFATRGTVNIYNANSKQLIRSYQKKDIVIDRLPILNSAIYLLELVPLGTQYVDAEASLQMQSMEQVMNPKKVVSKEVEAIRGEWQAKAVEGVKMQSLFEEPRKFTLRGQLKAAFSGSCRALVALQVPKGATDVLYSLRISTNEGSNAHDGKFADGMALSYHKVRFLGLPLYESQRGSGLIATLLGENQPPREEDAYINMFVFFDAGQARRFQNGEQTSKLKYHVDYSTMGTQSCNGRIPSRGRNTIYLGFENERMRYNNYVWLEAISAVPHTEYFKTHYTVK